MANTQTDQGKSSNTSNRGFASMDPEKQKEIAREGGKAAHESGNAHEFDSREAAEAGRKGGETVSQDREHMAEIGAEGGKARSDQSSGGGSSGSRSSSQQGEAGRQSHKNN